MHTTHPLLVFLFPPQPRALPQRRLWLGSVRSVHILCLAVVLGGLMFKHSIEAVYPWLVATVLSGLLLLILDMISSCVVLFELRGLSMLVKIPLVAAMPSLDELAALLLLAAVLVFSTLISHGTRKFRHQSLMPMRWRVLLDHHVSSSAERRS